MSMITAMESTSLYHKDWGKGPVVTFSHGWSLCSEACYIGRHGTKRVAKAVLIAAVPPLMLKTAANPEELT